MYLRQLTDINIHSVSLIYMKSPKQCIMDFNLSHIKVVIHEAKFWITCLPQVHVHYTNCKTIAKA